MAYTPKAPNTTCRDTISPVLRAARVVSTIPASPMGKATPALEPASNRRHSSGQNEWTPTHTRLISRNALSEVSTVRRQDTLLSHHGAVAVIRAIPVRSAEASRPVRVVDSCRSSPSAPRNEGSKRNIASVTVETSRSAQSAAGRSIALAERGVGDIVVSTCISSMPAIAERSADLAWCRRKADHRAAIVENLAEILLIRHVLGPHR